ncbi:predicted protein [Lichtheimia corymbifera JMRC:FSU:9682]|uniref:Uncharacterized protein n=1 Tax=Lichtheimia corymbifera JMRC:FSU:9682 TaxID=1263082 RepID=A0A068RPM8_9FUNG|nr:predicted protein [Lichtheimia corymbifera JMRC:FSU:9682]
MTSKEDFLTCLQKAPNPFGAELLADYLATAEKPSLEDFIARNAQKIAILGEPVKDLKMLWTGRYVKSTKLLDIPAVIGEPKWYAALQEILAYKDSIAGSQPAIKQASVPSLPILPDFLVQMKEKFANMTHDTKWILPSGTVVEDTMFAFANTLDYEHFILDIQDKCWEKAFSKDDIEYMGSIDQMELPDIDDPHVIGFVQSFNGQSTVDGLLKTISQHPYDSNEPYSLTWMKQSIFNACMVYKAGLSNRSLSETDMILHLWSPITYCYGDTNIIVNTGERESRATSLGRNNNRMLNARKLHDTKLDMKFSWEEYELGDAGIEVEESKDNEGYACGAKSLVSCPKESSQDFRLHNDGQNGIIGSDGQPSRKCMQDQPLSQIPDARTSKWFRCPWDTTMMLHLQVKEMMSSMISQLNTCPPSKIQLGKALPVADLSFSIISSPSPSSASSRSTSSSSCISSDNSSSTSNRKRKLSAVIP